MTHFAEFYRTKLGQHVQKCVDVYLENRWLKTLARKNILLGLGYTLPYLSQTTKNFQVFHALAESMPPPGGIRSHVFVCKEYYLPLSNESVEGIFLIHTLERQRRIQDVLREVWRILKYEGKICIIVPNSISMWRLWQKPFPLAEQTFSHAELIHLLQLHLFTPTYVSSSLFLPPIFGSLADGVNWMGRYFLPPFGGLLFIEASKNLVPKKKPWSKKRTPFAPGLSQRA